MSRGLYPTRSLSATAISVFVASLVACGEASPEPFGAIPNEGGSAGQPASEGATGGDVTARGGAMGNAGEPAAPSSGGEGGGSSGGTPAQGGSGEGVGGSPSADGGADVGVGGSVGGSGEAEGGNGGSGGSDGNPLAYCVYSDDVASGGAGGAGPGTANIIVRTDPFLGQYLADAGGKTLYIYGRDLPGDCNNPPVSACTSATCLSAWPPFYVEERVLAAGLDESLFGSVEGPSGPITTYRGWPLYYYATDAAPGQIAGQGKQGLWFAAEVVLPAIIPMRAVDATVNHLATSRGHALYVHALDTLGTAETPAVSACTGDCADRHVPLLSNTISVASSVEASDLSLFLRPDNQLQLAYKGAPLYLDAETPRPGALVTPIPEQWGLALK